MIASGSLLGIQYLTAGGGSSIPVGYERPVVMRPLDFEEFLWAKGYDEAALDNLRACFDEQRAGKKITLPLYLSVFLGRD